MTLIMVSQSQKDSQITFPREIRDAWLVICQLKGMTISKYVLDCINADESVKEALAMQKKFRTPTMKA